MDVLHVPSMPYGCDWDGECMAVFATHDELDAHERGHWDGLRRTVICNTLARVAAEKDKEGDA